MLLRYLLKPERVKFKSIWLQYIYIYERKGDKLYVKWKGYDHYFNSRIDKKIYLYQINYFELDLSNYATKFDLKNATHVNTSDFA